MAIDTETTGLDPHQDRLRLLQLAIPGQTIIIDLWQIPESAREPLRTLFAGQSLKVGHNLKFDLAFLQQANLSVTHLFDTMLAAQVLDSGLYAIRFGLDDVVQAYLGVELSKDLQVSDWSGSLTESQLDYAARDAAVLLPLRKRLLAELEKVDLIDVAWLEFDTLPAVVEMELTGMRLSLERMRELQRELAVEKDQTAERLYPELLRGQDLDNPWLLPAVRSINLDSPSQVLRALQALRVPVSDTSRGTLLRFARHPAVRALLAYRQAGRALTFATRLPQHVHPVTGRIHASYWQIGSSTGRFACASPNLQQIPKDSKFRRCFVPEPGNTFVIADFSQIELRVAAEISQDERMISAYRENEDLHALTASLITQIPPEHITSPLRQAAKAMNFGLLFGMQAPSLQSYARNTYDVRLTMRQAATFRRRFMEAYEGIAQWQRQTRQDRPEETRTLSGRRRRWRDQPRITQLLNSSVQGSAADLLKHSLTLLPEALAGTGARIVACIHDEVILESPEENAESVAEILKATMEQAGEVYWKTVQVVADVRIAESWAEKI